VRCNAFAEAAHSAGPLNTMCTCSWIRSRDAAGAEIGYDVMFNRDEQWSRKPALLPRLHVRNGARFIAPVDADAGGTWIGVNAFGVSIALLNRYQDSTPAPAAGAGFISRGQLVRSLLDSRAAAEVQSRIESLEPERFQPFTLIVLETGMAALLIEWSGRQLLIDEDADKHMPLASSSFEPLVAIAYRRELLARLSTGAPKVESLRAFHASREPGRAAYGPCMERDDAHTVSFSWIRVRPEQISFEYVPMSLCDAAAQSGHAQPFSVSITPAAAYRAHST
jgi:Transport and Golgi organisation 2